MIDTFQCNIPVRFLVIKNGKLFCSCNNLLVNLTPQNNVGGNFAFDSQNFSMQTKEDKHSIIIVKNLEVRNNLLFFFVKK